MLAEFDVTGKFVSKGGANRLREIGFTQPDRSRA